ncbi:RND family efflux transporter MFP subunit [Flammeovirgaceae bacterium 311]|nr:RND family efflux transporter MFP subunit [Flammeovirgaceae bacterium 311]
MDIEIPQEELQKQSRSRYLKIGAIGLVVVALFFGFRIFIKPSVDYRTLKTAQVVTGPIQASLTASGTVVPEYEQSISSPLQARIDSVYHPAGTLIKAGTPILKLDLSYSQVELEQLEDGLQKRRNEANLIRLRMEKNLADLQAQYDIKKLRISSLESELESERKLQQIGGGTGESVRQAELSLQIARRELQQLQEQILNQQQTNKADLTTLQFEISIDEKSVNELRRRMQQAEIRAERDGVIVYVKDKLGATVSAGEELVRLADLSRFKVSASMSEAYAPELKSGGRVLVRAGGQDLHGMITSIKPEVKSGLVTFEVGLEDGNAPVLRPNLQVDVYVVTAYKDNVLVVRNGAFYKGKNDQKVFVVAGDKAEARQVDIGLTNVDMVEISGLKEGDELILNDMSKYAQANELELENR